MDAHFQLDSKNLHLKELQVAAALRNVVEYDVGESGYPEAHSEVVQVRFLACRRGLKPPEWKLEQQPGLSVKASGSEGAAEEEPPESPQPRACSRACYCAAAPFDSIRQAHSSCGRFNPHRVILDLKP